MDGLRLSSDNIELPLLVKRGIAIQAQPGLGTHIAVRECDYLINVEICIEILKVMQDDTFTSEMRSKFIELYAPLNKATISNYWNPTVPVYVSEDPGALYDTWILEGKTSTQLTRENFIHLHTDTVKDAKDIRVMPIDSTLGQFLYVDHGRCLLEGFHDITGIKPLVDDLDMFENEEISLSLYQEQYSLEMDTDE